MPVAVLPAVTVGHVVASGDDTGQPSMRLYSRIDHGYPLARTPGEAPDRLQVNTIQLRRARMMRLDLQRHGAGSRCPVGSEGAGAAGEGSSELSIGGGATANAGGAHCCAASRTAAAAASVRPARALTPGSEPR